jgi:hypothetical protein
VLVPFFRQTGRWVGDCRHWSKSTFTGIPENRTTEAATASPVLPRHRHQCRLRQMHVDGPNALYSASCLLRISCSIQLDRLRPSASALPRAHSSDAMPSEMLVWVLSGARWPCLVFLAGLDALAVFLAGMAVGMAEKQTRTGIDKDGKI